MGLNEIRRALYEDRETFLGRRREGFTHVAYCKPDDSPIWINELRILGIVAFFHPDGRVETIEQPEISRKNDSRLGETYVTVYPSEEEFRSHVGEYGLLIENRIPIEDAIDVRYRTFKKW